jgi:hypothetical protein
MLFSYVPFGVVVKVPDCPDSLQSSSLECEISIIYRKRVGCKPLPFENSLLLMQYVGHRLVQEVAAHGVVKPQCQRS